MSNPILYTIGYGNRQPESFFKLLPDNCLLIDVRASPAGWHLEYRHKRLSKRFGRRYEHVRSLGNISGNADVWEPALGNNEKDKGLDFLECLVEGARINGITVVLMCAELDPMRCHRRFVAEEIAWRVPGLEIVHLGVKS